TQIDYFYRQIELKFSDGSHKVTDEKSIRKYGDDTEPMKNKNISNKERLKILLDEKLDTYIRKNADYGNSFEEQFKEYGLLSLVIRLDDKLRRLKQLMNNEAKVKDESIRDTLLDLSNYSDMGIMELDKLNKNN